MDGLYPRTTSHCPRISYSTNYVCQTLIASPSSSRYSLPFFLLSLSCKPNHVSFTQLLRFGKLVLVREIGLNPRALEHHETFHVALQAYNEGMTTKEIFDLTAIDPWWLENLQHIHDTELWLNEQSLDDLTADDWREVKSRGFSDAQIARCVSAAPLAVREKRLSHGVKPSYKRVDTCAAEFAAETPYLYSCYEVECEAAPTTNKKVLILGGGPNRIGQGIEFDYCCCHASYSLRDAGYETIMMNSNPETVSTDYDTSSRLYFEPLTVEDVLNVIEVERPEGIIVQFGGQTPLKLAMQLQNYLDANPIPASSGEGNVRIWGTSPMSIDEAEDRDRWMDLLNKLDIRQPAGGSARYAHQRPSVLQYATFGSSYSHCHVAHHPSVAVNCCVSV
jgi:carbamoyl-phosphate synthase large subunit